MARCLVDVDGLRSSTIVSAKHDVRKALRLAEDALETEMRRIGAMLTHGATVGGGREHAVAKSIQATISQLIVLRRGQIFAPGVSPSSEWDVILCDPATRPLAGIPSAVPIESVLAVVSVKSNLTSAAVDEGAVAAARLRAMVQEPADRPLPAVFAIGLDGIQPATLKNALAQATREHGPFSRFDGVLVLKSHSALPLADGYVVQADSDAFVRWILAIDQAVSRAPRRPVSLELYLRVDDEPEEDGGQPPPEPKPPFPPDRGRDAVPALGADVALRDRHDGRNLGASRTVGRLIAELESQDPDAVASLRTALDDPAGLAAFAADHGGPLLDVVGRLLSVLGEHAAAGDLLLRWAKEPDADRVQASVDAASCLRRAGQTDRADAVLARVADEGARHPALLLSKVVRLDDAEDRLQALDDIEITTARDRARAVMIRAEALSELGRDNEAVEDVRSTLAERWSPDLAERLAILLSRSQPRTPYDVGPEPVVEETVVILAELVSEWLALGLPDMAMHIDSRLVHALWHMARQDLVTEMANYWLSRASGRDASARTSLALALLDALEFDAARAIAPDPLPEDTDARLLGARLALIETDDAATAESAVATLDELLDRRDLLEHQRFAVAHERALAAGAGLADWSEVAGVVLAAESRFYHDMLRARYLAKQGDDREAEALLLNHSDEPAGVRALIDLAAQAERWDRVVTLVDGLGDRAPADERGRRAHALERLGHKKEAEAAFHEVALAEDASPYDSERASLRLAHLLADRRQWEQLAGIAEDWYRRRPDSPLAIWVLTDTLGRTGHAERAWRVIEEDGRPPSTTSQRRFVAMLASKMLALPDALQRIAALSDEVNRSDEHLEAMLITLSAGSDKAVLSQELAERVRLTFADFAKRFPESTIVQQFEAPTTEPQLADFAKRLAKRERVAAEMERAVVIGQGALAALAVFGGTALSVWIESDLLPLVAPIAEMQEAERADAAAAIAGPVVWDSSALAVLSRLHEDAAEALLRAVPASTMPRAVEDEVYELPRLVAERDPIRSPGTLALRHGLPVIVARTTEQLEALRTQAQRVKSTADRLTTLDPDLADEGEIVDALRDEKLHGSAAAWLSATLLARQRGIPLLCDDRYLRLWARRLGIATFGTAALLQAVAERGLLSNEQLHAELWTLRAAGGRFLPAEPIEILERITQDNYEISPAVDGLLRDPDVWTDTATQFAQWNDTLAAIWHARPDALYRWLVYLVDRIASTLRMRRPAIATMLLLPALGGQHDVEYLRALLAAMRRCNLEAFDLGDPLSTAFSEIRRREPGLDEELHRMLVVRALSRLPITEQLKLLGAD
ncbi:MAG: PIN domain-containing protein [Solirubrobacteraceae bacterium]